MEEKAIDFQHNVNSHFTENEISLKLNNHSYRK